MGVAFEVVDRLLPVGREDVLVLPIEALVNVCPWSCVQLCRRVPLGGQLVFRELMLVNQVDQEQPVVSLGSFGEGKQTAALAPDLCRTVSFFLAGRMRWRPGHVAYHSVHRGWCRIPAWPVAVVLAAGSGRDP